jgi:pyruvate kinase
LEFKKTKIICTIGPAVEDPDVICQLINEGMDAARLNFSHGTQEDHLRYINNIKQACEKTELQVALIQDLQGPKIRVGKLENGFIILKEKNYLTIVSEDITGNSDRISTSYKELINDVKENDIILFDDGNFKLRVVSIERKLKEIKCEILNGGLLKEHKGINLPNTDINLPSLTDKDMNDLQFGLMNNIDFVAMSFVRSADDIKLLRGILRSRGKSSIPIIAKIERPEAIKNIDSIIEEADLIMVARGDLGVEISTEQVPVLQKMIIKKCNEKIKPVITATQMLESMIEDPTPTRAEASDIANAILDGTDCVMLSAETSTGKFPVLSVKTMCKIILKTETIMESKFFNEIFVEDSPENTLHTICNSAVEIAARVNAKAIITITTSGKSALLLSNHRPKALIIASTFDERLLKKLKLVWGVKTTSIEKKEEYREIVQLVKQKVLNRKLAMQGDRVVIVASDPFTELDSANMIEVGEV